MARTPPSELVSSGGALVDVVFDMDSFSHTVEGYLQPQATDSPLPFVTLGAVNKSGRYIYI